MIKNLLVFIGVRTPCCNAPFRQSFDGHSNPLCEKCFKFAGRVKERPCVKHFEDSRLDSSLITHACCGWTVSRTGSVVNFEPGR